MVKILSQKMKNRKNYTKAEEYSQYVFRLILGYRLFKLPCCLHELAPEATQKFYVH